MTTKIRSATVAGDRLRSFVERVERLEEEKAAIQNDIKEVYAEAKGDGYDVKTIRQVIRQRKMDPADRVEQLTMFDLYWDAIEGGANDAEIERRKPARKRNHAKSDAAMERGQ
ncbi:DUF2312 domain-containing protein [Hyphococcus sp.]|uniref:DUF2312 domain-containing protein n=1 Tax=Hyphococcus sp. TaxID=2038636 RepID=UPI00207DE47C|nr:MAG: hypothetical protein DHS20C04_32230 [Marinicaulis sp.]